MNIRTLGPAGRLLALAFAGARLDDAVSLTAEVAAQMNANLPRWFSLFIGVAEAAAGDRPAPARGDADHAVPGGVGRGRAS